jgi:hypothetical protein
MDFTDMARIFISYRRADAADAAGRLFDRLVATFGKANVFKDVDSIPFGHDFAKVIAERLSDCNVVIVVIGRFWLTVRSSDGTPRLHNPRDYLRIEFEQALKSRALVIPALVGNVSMPREEQLPESIRKLSRKHAIAIRPDPDFHKDMDRLIRALQALHHQPEEPPRARDALLNSWLLAGVVAAGCLAVVILFALHTRHNAASTAGANGHGADSSLRSHPYILPETIPLASDNRRFWRFAPRYAGPRGSGYFRMLNRGTWEEIGGKGEVIAIWNEVWRTAEYVALHDPRRGYKTRLGEGKAWLASVNTGVFNPSPEGNWVR